MSRYDAMFQRLDEDSQAAFVPFVVLGDPDLPASLEIVKALVEGGADALELGFPFSDPLADGPTIQDAMDRALKASVTPADCLNLIREIRAGNDDIPVGLLVYANLVYSWGLDAFYRDCKGAGVDSVLVADVPVNESATFCHAARKNRVDPIMLCPPNIDDEALKLVSVQGSGYTYLLSRAGVTGTNVAAVMPVEHLLSRLESHQAPRPLLGFGISQPDHVIRAIRAGAGGVIVGSAIVQIIQKHLGDLNTIRKQLIVFTRSMKAATSRNK